MILISSRERLWVQAECSIDCSAIADHIDIESLQNRSSKVCYVPVTSAGLPIVRFFFSFFLLLRPLIVLMKQTRQAACAIKSSIFLDVYGWPTFSSWLLIVPNTIKGSSCSSAVKWDKINDSNPNILGSLPCPVKTKTKTPLCCALLHHWQKN